jgi:addiction module HigA family antidote
MPAQNLLINHPGRILQDKFLEPLGISQARLAKDINVPLQRITGIVLGTRSVTTDIAHRLAHYFGMSERFWLNLQAQYDRKQETKLSKELPTKQAPRYAE